MRKRFVLLLLVAAVIASIPTMALCGSKGNHYGELKQIDGTIEFKAPVGKCVADSTGLTYYYNGGVYHQNIVYISQYWGEYDLYLPGTVVPTKVTIVNAGPHAVAKHDVVTDAHYINTDGSLEVLLAPSVQTIEVSLGETKYIDASFALPSSAKPGLDMFSVKLYHHYNVDSPDASLVVKFDGVFCPPELLQ